VRVAAGETQRAVAADYRIFTGLCCEIIKGDIWNPAKYRVGIRGSEMRRRDLSGMRFLYASPVPIRTSFALGLWWL
jgi:hypothetical protein